VILVQSAVAARIGHPRRALRLVNAIDKLGARDPELRAWCWNIRSIALGKLERSVAYLAATDQTVRFAREAGNTWLSQSAELRRIHKKDWATAERGQQLSDGELEGAVRAAVEDAESLTASELRHLRAQQDAYLALHYTWDPRTVDLAERAILSAESRFGDLGDNSELARMYSERGRLYLLSDTAEGAAAALRTGLRRRLEGGEYPRARYDLIWLGKALLQTGRDVDGETCLWLVLSIHSQIYGNSQVDGGVIRDAKLGLDAAPHAIAKLGRRRVLDKEYLSSLVQTATGLNPTETLSLIDLGRLREVIASGRPI
jgi:hypothetical protein